MKILSKSFLYSIILSAFCSTTFASRVWLPEEEPALRTNACHITDEDWEKFQAAKSFYHNALSSGLPIAEQIPFYELTNPQTGHHFFILGTYHHLPYECLPDWFNLLLKRQIDEVYLESPICTYLSTIGSQPIKNTDKLQLSEAMSEFLTPLLNIFSKRVEDLTLGEIYSTVMGFDAFLGLDATIELLSLRSKKPVFMLDQKIDNVQTNLQLHRKNITKSYASETDEENKSELKSQLESSDEDLMSRYIKDEIIYLMKEFSDQKKFLDHLNNDLTDWSQEPTEVLEPHDIEDFNNMEVLERNERWIELLKDLPPSSSKRKLIAVGAGHLLDLFERFKSLGYTVEKYAPPVETPLNTEN